MKKTNIKNFKKNQKLMYKNINILSIFGSLAARQDIKMLEKINFIRHLLYLYIMKISKDFLNI